MTQLIENTLLGGGLILVTAGLRRLLKGRVAPGGWLALWAVCLGRLLTPVPWRSPLSLLALNRPRTVRPAVVPPAPPAGVAAGTPAPAAGASVPPLAVLWAAVALAAAVWLVAAWLSVRRQVRKNPSVPKGDPRYDRLPAGTVLREGPMRGAPLTFGVLRPSVVLLPELEAPELGYVLAHEGAHVRRRDNLWHYAVAAALVLHWFNPAVWLMAGLLGRDVEMACDRAVLRALGSDRRAAYARTLVDVSAKAKGLAFCRSFGQKRAEERIVAIMKYKKTTAIGAILAVALALCLTIVLASTPAKAEEAGTEQKDYASMTTELGSTPAKAEDAEPEKPDYASMTTEELAYCDLDEAPDEETRQAILDARRQIIYSTSWTADGGEAYIMKYPSFEVVEKIPEFHDIFPEDWEIPKCEPSTSVPVLNGVA